MAGVSAQPVITTSDMVQQFVQQLKCDLNLKSVQSENLSFLRTK